MTYPIQSVESTVDSPLDDLRDAQEIFVMLALALAVIASPTTPIIVARVTAVFAQHTAMAWAELLDDAIAEQGGDV